MEEDLIAALLGAAGVAAIVAKRISWSTRPVNAPLPAIVMHKVSAPRDYTLTGRVGLVGALVQIDCWATSYGAAKLLSRAVVDVLDTLTAAPFSSAQVANERDDFEADSGPQGAAASTLFRTSLDVRIWHDPTA